MAAIALRLALGVVVGLVHAVMWIVIVVALVAAVVWANRTLKSGKKKDRSVEPSSSRAVAAAPAEDPIEAEMRKITEQLREQGRGDLDARATACADRVALQSFVTGASRVVLHVGGPGARPTRLSTGERTRRATVVLLPSRGSPTAIAPWHPTRGSPDLVPRAGARGLARPPLSRR